MSGEGPERLSRQWAAEAVAARKARRPRRGPGMTQGARRAVVLLFVLTLGVGIGNLAFSSHQASSVASARAAAAQAQARAAAAKAQAAAVRAAQMALCRAGNESRVQQADLWEFILRLSGPPTSAREQTIRAEFVHHLHVVFAPRDCAALGKKPRS